MSIPTVAVETALAATVTAAAAMLAAKAVAAVETAKVAAAVAVEQAAKVAIAVDDKPIQAPPMVSGMPTSRCGRP